MGRLLASAWRRTKSLFVHAQGDDVYHLLSYQAMVDKRSAPPRPPPPSTLALSLASCGEVPCLCRYCGISGRCLLRIEEEARREVVSICDAALEATFHRLDEERRQVAAEEVEAAEAEAEFEVVSSSSSAAVKESLL